MDDEDKILCICGPLDGTRVECRGDSFLHRLPNPHRETSHMPPHVPQCLEIEEIKALTGSTGHRTFGPIREVYEIDQLLTYRYELRSVISEAGEYSRVYVCTQASDRQLAIAINALREMILAEDPPEDPRPE